MKLAVMVMLLGGTGAGFAQQAVPGVGSGAASEPGRCARLAAWADPFVARTPGGAMEAVGIDGCRFGTVRFGTGRIGYEAASVLVRGLPLTEHAAGAVRVEARGMKLSVHTGQPKTDWMLQQQQVSSFDVVVDFDYDPAAHRLVLHEFSLDGELAGRVELQGVFEGLPDIVGAGSMLPQADDVGVRALRVRLDSRRFLANYLLSAVIPMLPDADFVATFERGRAEVAAVAVQVAAAAGGAAEDKEALLGFVHDVPQPKHAFELSFEAGATALRPWAVVEAVEKGVGLEALLAGSTMTASYDGAVR